MNQMSCFHGALLGSDSYSQQRSLHFLSIGRGIMVAKKSNGNQTLGFTVSILFYHDF